MPMLLSNKLTQCCKCKKDLPTKHYALQANFDYQYKVYKQAICLCAECHSQLTDRLLDELKAKDWIDLMQHYVRNFRAK
jgi:hypothetical protein